MPFKRHHLEKEKVKKCITIMDTEPNPIVSQEKEMNPIIHMIDTVELEEDMN